MDRNGWQWVKSGVRTGNVKDWGIWGSESAAQGLCGDVAGEGARLHTHSTGSTHFSNSGVNSHMDFN